MRVSGLILAGGRGRRMNSEDKGRVKLAGKPMVEWVIERLAPQVDEIIINANRNIEDYKLLNYQVIADTLTGYQGPLAGILSGLRLCQYRLMVCVPCDTPFFPADIVIKMIDKQKAANADVVSVSDGERTHPVFALIKTELARSLNDYLSSGQRKIDHWYGQHNYQLIEYSNGEHFFENINTHEQLINAEQRLKNHD